MPLARYCAELCPRQLEEGGCSLLCNYLHGMVPKDHETLYRNFLRGCNNVCDTNLASCMTGSNVADISVKGKSFLLSS